VDPEAEALYGLPLEEFTRARDALARARAKAGDREAAAGIKALRKPSVVAWALNQLARRHPDDVARLLEAGARLRQAQTAALEGGDPSELREAGRAEASEVSVLAGVARSILAEAGRSGALEDRLATTLRAAATDPEGGEQLKRGALTAELNPAGFGFGTGIDEVEHAPAPRRADRGAETKAEAKARAQAEAAAEAERRRAEEREDELRAAEDDAERLARQADEAEEVARQAREEARAAKKALNALRKGGSAPRTSKGRKG
jgi:hypothetical protein